MSTRGARPDQIKNLRAFTSSDIDGPAFVRTQRCKLQTKRPATLDLRPAVHCTVQKLARGAGVAAVWPGIRGIAGSTVAVRGVAGRKSPCCPRDMQRLPKKFPPRRFLIHALPPLKSRRNC